MRIKTFAALLIGFLPSGCAATTPAPGLFPGDPADPKARAAQVPSPSTLLQLLAWQPTTAGPPREPGRHEHHGEGPPGDTASVAEVYSCPMHPQVREENPGKCRICGMTLVKLAAQPKSEPEP